MDFRYLSSNKPLDRLLSNGLFFFGMISLVLLFSTCQKERVEIIWEEQTSSTESTLSAVHFTDENTGYIVGGDTWYYGVSLETTDGGKTWQADSLTNKQMFGLHFSEDGVGYATGIDGQVFKKKQGEDWGFHRFPRWELMRAICFYDENNGITVGGGAYSQGVIQHFTDLFNVDSTMLTDYELSDVCYSDAQTAHAVGYGTVLRSTDSGYTWELKSTEGDFFRSVHFPSTTVGYAVGTGGTIIKTTDAGENWEKIRDGSRLVVKDIAFRSVHFVTEDKGYIVGDEGVFWATEDGGDNWQIATNLPDDTDFHDVFAINNKGWIVGTEGKIFSFQH